MGRCSRHRSPFGPSPGSGSSRVAQLVPLPEPLHRLIAPGSAAVWHPDVPAAAAVLGPGPRPISLHPEATRRSLAFATGLLALALVAAPALRDRRTLLRASIAIVAGGVAVALYGLVARLVFTNKLYGIWSVPTVGALRPVREQEPLRRLRRARRAARGRSRHRPRERGAPRPGFLSWIESSRARWVVVAWGAAAILILAVPVCLSRGGVVSLAAGLVAFAGLRLWSRRDSRLSPRGLIGLAGGAALLLVALVSVLPAEARDRVLTLAGVTTDQSGSYRLAVWRDTGRLARSSPWVGSGFGAFEDALPRFKTAAGQLAVEHAENDYLELLAEGGIVAAWARHGPGGSGPHPGSPRRGEPRRPTGPRPRDRCRGRPRRDRRPQRLRFQPADPLERAPVRRARRLVLAVPANGTARTPRLLVPFLLLVTLAVALLTPWTAPRVDPGPMLRAAHSGDASLRRAGLEADLIAHLQRRPADAAAWLALAWLRLPTSRDEASSLADWAVRLHPTSQAVRDARSSLDARPAR